MTLEPIEFRSAQSLNAHVNERMIPLLLNAPSDDVHGAMWARQIVDLQGFRLDVSPHQVVQRVTHAGGHPRQLAMTLQVSGTSMIEQFGNRSVLEAGDMTIFDITQPSTRVFSEYSSTFVALIPVVALSGAIDPQHHFGRKLDSLGLSCRLLSDLATQVALHLDEIGSHEEYAIRTSLVSTLRATLERPRGDGMEQAGALGHQWWEIQEHIRQHATDPQLRLATVAEAFHVSPRLIQRIFQFHGATFSSFVRDCRLDRLDQLLRSPEHPDATVSDLAYRSGFSDPGYAGSQYRLRFGQRPRDVAQVVRSQALGIAS